MNRAVITTSWDDGHPLDLKLAELLRRYDIPATFYVPIENVERECMNMQQIREVAQHFDIGGHGYHHLNLTAIPPEEAEKEVMEGKKRLEDIIGRQVLSFCYPYGFFNDEVISLVKKAGFIGARTTRALSRSIKDSFQMGVTINAADARFGYRVKSSIYSADPGLLCFTLMRNLYLKNWEKMALSTLDFVVRKGGIWHLWGHSWEVDENNDWERLEEVLHGISLLAKWAYKVDNSQLIRMYTDKG